MDKTENGDKTESGDKSENVTRDPGSAEGLLSDSELKTVVGGAPASKYHTSYYRW